MTQHIGIVACSAEGAALCYRTICAEAGERMGQHRHPEITLHTLCLADYMTPIRAGDWGRVAEMMLTSTRKVAEAGADFAISPDNTIHQAFDRVAAESPIPWLHIAEVVGKEASALGFRRLGVTGTRYLMAGPVYATALGKLGLACEVPEAPDRERINDIIFGELVNGSFPEPARLFFNTVFDKFKRQGCDAAVLGCTEIPLLVDPNDCPLPALDSTRLLARAALRRALS